MKNIIKKTICTLLMLVMIFALMPHVWPSAEVVTHAAQEITIRDGIFKISDLVKSTAEGGYGLISGDTLKVDGSTTLVIDQDFTLEKINPASLVVESLTIKGTNTLTVEHGINLGAYGAFFMDSGTLQVTGPYASGNPNSGIYAPTVTITGGKIDITFAADYTISNPVGFQTNWFTLKDGQVNVDISGSGSGYITGIYSAGDTGFAAIKGGTLTIDAESSFGYPRGIYNTHSNYVVDIKGGTTNIKSRRTNDGNYADAAGISGAGLSFHQSAGSLTMSVNNAGQDSYGIRGGYFDISGGSLDIYAGTSKEGRAGYGIYTDEDATFKISGGTVKLNGSTYSSVSGTGCGLLYRNTQNDRYLDISGGTVEITGAHNGIHVHNSSENEQHENYIGGDAKVTVTGYHGMSIYGVRDGGWGISGTAELSSLSQDFAGLFTAGHVTFSDLPTVTLEGESISGVNRCAICAEKGITLADTVEITCPAGGKLGMENKTIYDDSNHYAKKVIIGPKDVVKVNVMFYDEFTGEKITDGSVMVYKNEGPWQAAGEDAVSFYVGKGEDFTLTVGEAAGSSYESFSGWYKSSYPGTRFNTNTTITQNITSDTWYYAEFAPPKTEITSMTLTMDKVPLPGMTRADKANVTIEEEGISIISTAWLDSDGNHLADDYVFKSGDGVKLMIDYAVAKEYKLAGSIESNTTLNGESTGIINDTRPEVTAIYRYYTIPEIIRTINVENIYTALDPVNTVSFTANVSSKPDTDGVEFYNKMDITDEGWTSGGEPDIKLSSPLVPTVGRSYTHNIWLRAKDSWAFDEADNITLVYDGTTVTGITPVISSDRKMVWIAGLEYAQINPVDISSASVALSPTTYQEDGSAKTPAVTVKDGSRTLVNGTDYTVAYSNNVKAGTATAAITGKGNYTGTKTASFTITAKPSSSSGGLGGSSGGSSGSSSGGSSSGSGSGSVASGFFPDVADPSKAYYKPVYWAAGNDVIKGYKNGNFGPSDSCTRAQFVTIIWRMAGRPSASAVAGFSDVNGSMSAYKAINWAVGEGIIVGYKDNTFRPDNPVTRGQLLTMLWRWLGKPAAAGSVSFPDVTSDMSAYKAIMWGANEGIIKGSGGLFHPSDNCLRQQIVTIFYRCVREGTLDSKIKPELAGTVK